MPPSGDNHKCLQTSPGGEGDKIGNYWGVFTGQILKSQIFAGFFFLLEGSLGIVQFLSVLELKAQVGYQVFMVRITICQAKLFTSLV